MEALFHKYSCGCIGIPVDKQNGLMVKACDDSGEYFMGHRDMGGKPSEPLPEKEQEELIREISTLIARGYGVTDFAHLIDRIMDKGGK